MKKKLPFRYPPITSYISVAHILSPLWPYKNVIMPWFCQQYIQLVSTKGYGDFYDCVTDNRLSFPIDCPFFEFQLLDKRNMYPYPEKFSEFLEYHILNNNYVIASIDDYYVNSGWNYRKKHFSHLALIYGCDTTEKKFLVADFFGNKYTQAEIEYKYIDEGDNSMPTDLARWYNEITIFKFIKRHEPFPLKIELIKLLLSDYINSRDSFYKLNYSRYQYGKYYYGLAYYDNLIETLNQDKNIDIRLFHLLYDHKVAMLLRLDYLYKNSCLDTDSYERLSVEIGKLKKANFNLRQMAIKYFLRPKKEDLDKMIQKCISLKQEEYDTFSFMLDALV